jgi:hypothetical protein
LQYLPEADHSGWVAFLDLTAVTYNQSKKIAYPDAAISTHWF